MLSHRGAPGLPVLSRAVPEASGSCPVCGVALVAFEKLPPVGRRAQRRRRRRASPSRSSCRSRTSGAAAALLTALALAGLVAFFLPWIDLTMPDIASLSGFALAQRLGWAWGAGVAWFILVPTVLSRRTHLPDARRARRGAFLAAVPGTDRGRAPRAAPARRARRAVRFTFGPALYATLGRLRSRSLVAALSRRPRRRHPRPPRVRRPASSCTEARPVSDLRAREQGGRRPMKRRAKSGSKAPSSATSSSTPTCPRRSFAPTAATPTAPGAATS